MLSILPFNNRVVKIQVTGATIRAALEHGVESFEQELQPGRFPQVSGIRFAFDANRKPGARLTSVTVNGKVLDDRQNYTLATTTYVAVDFGDGYDMFRGAAFLIRPEQGQVESDILQNAVASVKSIAPQADGRIQRRDVAKDQNACP